MNPMEAFNRSFDVIFADRAADAILSIENRERYMAQSAATRDGELAALPARARLTYDPNPPSADEVIEAGNWKYGLAQEAD